MSDLTDDDIQRIWDECFRATPPRVRPPVCVFARAVIAASQEGRTALPASTATQCDSGPSAAALAVVAGWNPYRKALAELVRLREVDVRLRDAARNMPNDEIERTFKILVSETKAAWAHARALDEGTAPRTALEAQQEGAMPPALVERGIERRKHRENIFSGGSPRKFRLTGERWDDWSLDRRIKDRRRA